MKKDEFIDCIRFLWEEFSNNPITEGPLKGEYNCSLAVGQMKQIGACLAELKKGEKK